MIKLVIFLSIWIAGVQNKTGAYCLLSPSPLPPVNKGGLKLVCIVNIPPPLRKCYRLQTTDHRLQTTDYRLKTTDY